jgi:hypothetical protein
VVVAPLYAEARKENRTVDRGVNRGGLFPLWFGQLLEKLGGRTRARTWDPMIKSYLDYSNHRGLMAGMGSKIELASYCNFRYLCR